MIQASIIIPTFSRCELAMQAITALQKQTVACELYEIILVVDGSTDQTAARARELCIQNLRVLEQENSGPAAARNAGARVAQGKLLVFVDDDMECSSGLVKAHLDFHSHHVNAVGIGAIQVSEQSASRLAAEYFERELGAHLNSKNQSMPTGIWSFANTSIRSEAFWHLGGFDEHFRMREDAELGARLENCGMRAGFVPDALANQTIVKHSDDLIRESEMFADADLQFLQKHPSVAPHRFLQRLEQDSTWKRRVRDWLALHLGMVDLCLGALCALGERFSGFDPVRRAAVRVLQLQCGLHWYYRTHQLQSWRH